MKALACSRAARPQYLGGGGDGDYKVQTPPEGIRYMRVSSGPLEEHDAAG